MTSIAPFSSSIAPFIETINGAIGLIALFIKLINGAMTPIAPFLYFSALLRLCRPDCTRNSLLTQIVGLVVDESCFST